MYTRGTCPIRMEEKSENWKIDKHDTCLEKEVQNKNNSRKQETEKNSN